jgi:hypothetical protein
MNRRPLLTTSALVAALVLMSALALLVRPASAQSAGGLTLSLTASATKAKIGDFVGYTARLENTGSETIPALSVNLGLPDALDARAVTCPGDTQGSVTFCELGDFAPGAIAEVLFVVQIGAKAPNGPVAAFAASADTVLATATVAPIKIVGPSRR